jgi:hypothetical protein
MEVLEIKSLKFTQMQKCGFETNQEIHSGKTKSNFLSE